MSALTPDAVAETAGPDWLRARRSAAFERFRATPLPTAAEEVWRYSRVDQLDLEAFAGRPAVPEPGRPRLPGGLESVLAAAGSLAALATTVDGHLTAIEPAAGAAVEIVNLAGSGAESGAEAGELLGAVAAEGDAFGSLNLALAASPLFIRARARQRVRGPVVIVHWVATGAVTVAPRTVVQVDREAELTVIEVVASAGEPTLVVPVTELAVADAGHLGYANVQMLGGRAWQVGYQVSQVGRDATFRSSAVAVGGEYARVRTDSRITGQGGSSHMSAVYFGTGDQMHDFRTLQDHDAPKSTSNLLFKGAVADRSHSVYSGLIRVRKGAVGTNALQTNRNLVLGAGAHADSVPNLEIEENEVRCNHASAVGPIDAEQRFYLGSRGIPPSAADRLIVLGFLDEVLERVPGAALQAQLRREVAAKLDTVEAR
jgi:Fe-S cluster assembly protein SufD